MEWWDCSSEPEGSTWHMCSFRAWSFQPSPPALPPGPVVPLLSPGPTESCLSSWRIRQCSGSKGGSLGVGSIACPPLCKLSPPLTPPPATPAPSLSCEEEGAVPIPALAILSGCAIPQGRWQEGAQRGQTTFLTVISNKTSLQWAASLNHKGQNVSCTCWCYLNPQLHAHTFAWLTIGIYKLAVSPGYGMLSRWPCGLRILIIPLSPIFQGLKGSISHHLIKIWCINFKLSK